MELKNIFEKLWMDYAEQNPSAQNIHDLFVSRGEKVMNDHIAFRTFNHPRLSIDVLAEPFLKNGYIPKGEYHFEQKHLFARHFEHPSLKDAPRVFISELLLQGFSEYLQQTVKTIIEQVPQVVLSAHDLIFQGNIFGIPGYETYKKLRAESEYAAWVYVYGYRANHFTVSVNALKEYNTLEKVNDLLKENGFELNRSGGEIKGTPEELLRQSSTLADIIPVSFKEGTEHIPACYYEFAQRYPDKNGNLYSGFIAKSADKIFESTDYRNTKQK